MHTDFESLWHSSCYFPHSSYPRLCGPRHCQAEGVNRADATSQATTSLLNPSIKRSILGLFKQAPQMQNFDTYVQKRQQPSFRQHATRESVTPCPQILSYVPVRRPQHLPAQLRPRSWITGLKEQPIE